MKPTRQPCIRIELLEARDCPSLSVVLSGGNLLLYGQPTPNSTLGTTGGLQITQTANDRFQVKDHGNDIGAYMATNVALNLVNHAGTSINFNLGGNTLTGNISVNLGTGDNSGVTTTGLAIVNGTLNGNLLIRNGSGSETVYLGTNTADVPSNLTVGGNVSFFGKSAGNSPSVTGNLLDSGINALTTPPVFIGGNFTTNAVNGIGLAGSTTIGGNVFINGGGVPFQSMLTHNFAALVGATVGGNVTITGTPGSAGDFVATIDGNTTAGATIGGNVSINLGQGPNFVQLAGTIGGNANVTAGNGTSGFQTGSLASGLQVNGNLTFNLGNGDNTFFQQDGATAGLASNAFVNGNLDVTLGNGANNLGTIAATAYGDMNINLGNGANAPVTLAGPAANPSNVGGTFNWISGNGGDSLTIATPTTAGVQAMYNVNVLFGNADDIFTVGTATGGAGSTVEVSGRADGGGRILGNTFVQDPSGILAPFFTLSNFP
jgi:hypothetical protein